MRSRSLFILLAISLVALVVPGPAATKEIVTTACGRDRCRTVVDGVSGVAVLPVRAQAPSRGRYYTVAVRFDADGTVTRWRLVYEATRHLVRAGNAATGSFLGSRWRVLAPDVRRAYSLAVKGLEPMPAPPRSIQAQRTRRAGFSASAATRRGDPVFREDCSPLWTPTEGRCA